MAGNDLNVIIGADLTAYNQALNQAATTGANFANNAATGISNAMDRVSSATDRANAGLALSIEEIQAWDAAARNSSQRTNPLGGNIVAPTLPSEINTAAIAVQGLAREEQTLGGATLSASMRMQQSRSALATFRSGAILATQGGASASRSIVALTHHFTSLINETGGVKQAFSALMGSVAGPGGILLGIGLAIEALNAYSEAQQKAADEANKLNKVLADGEGKMGGEVANLQSLVAIGRDENSSRQTRINAINEINRLYPEYLGNLNIENINSKKVEEQIKRTTKALIDQAKAQALISAIAEENKKGLEASTKTMAQGTTLWSRVLGAVSMAAGGMGTLGMFDAINNNADELIESSKKAKVFTDALESLNKEMAKNDEFKKEKPKTLKDKVDKDAWKKDLFGHQSTPKGVKIEIAQRSAPDDILAQMQAYVQLTEAKRNDLIVSKEQQAAYEEQQNIIQSLTETIGQGLVNAFQSLVSGGGDFLQKFGDFIVQLIEKLVAAAAAAALLAILLSATGFGAVGGISGAASSFGSFKNLFGSFSGVKLAEGGITNGPTRALIGEGGEREAVMPLSKLQRFVNTNGGGAMANGQMYPVLVGPNLFLKWQNRSTQTGSRT